MCLRCRALVRARCGKTRAECLSSNSPRRLFRQAYAIGATGSKAASSVVKGLPDNRRSRSEYRRDRKTFLGITLVNATLTNRTNGTQIPGTRQKKWAGGLKEPSLDPSWPVTACSRTPRGAHLVEVAIRNGRYQPFGQAARRACHPIPPGSGSSVASSAL